MIRNEIEPFGLPPWSARYSSTAATLQAMPPFMSTAPRPYRKPSLTSPENAPWLQAASSPAGTTSVCPAKLMCGTLLADPGIEIVDIGGAGFAEGDAMHLEAGSFQDVFENSQRAGVGRGDGRAPHEVAGNGNGVIHVPRLT